ncbi:hypothetical protein [Allostreptomyces psammosilenae]|uniref:DUF3800 domain-containing protein n=1 Tax=Allostreptomyces psammosilenae TaxID=1892865 RepID=A0A853A6R0_9ACTN|nr:hypothetical protein [Allostreptomyces psammosilenae]NYI06228.1 hypothetical protein [Allostreptomyces psammosilenae]
MPEDDRGEAVWRAYLDESEPDRRVSPGVYLMAAAVPDPEAVEPVRETLRLLRRPEQRKLHWHAESAKRRREIVEAIVALPALHVVVVLNGQPGESSERRRRKCLRRMAWELDQRDVVELVAEARERKQNGRDLEVFQALRAERSIRAGLRLFHEPGPSEPLLWIADAIAGAYTAWCAGDPVYYETVAPVVDLVECDA